ncbi:unnamed protein product [Caretta caretta]
MRRWCSKAKETIPFISGQCFKIKNARIKKHNRILHALIDNTNKLCWKALIEPHLRNKEGDLRKPDIIFVRNGAAAMVDVMVWWEDNAYSLETTHKDKVEYYSELEEDIKMISGRKIIFFYGFVLGAPGKWNKDNNELLILLGIDRNKQFKENFCRLALYSTADMMALFSDKQRSRILILCILQKSSGHFNLNSPYFNWQEMCFLGAEGAAGASRVGAKAQDCHTDELFSSGSHGVHGSGSRNPFFDPQRLNLLYTMEGVWGKEFE